MADYIYTMEIRLTPDQQRGVTLVQDIARGAGMNIYLTGGAVRDIISGFSIRDLDFTVQGNPLKLQKELERAGAVISGSEDDLKVLYLTLPGNVRAEISSSRTERYEKAGKPPVVTPATIIEDLKRRDFTINAMALSLNPGSRGLLMDPFNGAADIENKVLRILHNYAFVEDPSRLLRASRFSARFGWPLEERTQARFESAKENNYIEYISDRAIGHEIEQLAYEDDPLQILKVLEKENWLKVLNPHWTTAKVDTAGLSQLLKTRQQMNELGYTPDPSAAVLYFLTAKLGDKDITDMRKLIPRKTLVDTWKHLEDEAKDLSKRLSGKEAATPSRAWKLLSEEPPENILFLAVTVRQQAVDQKIKNFFTKWRQVQQKVPLAEMTELHINPQMPEYPKIAHEVFMLLLDGKLRSHTEIMKFLKPLAPPPPPPPPPPPAKRGRAAKAVAATAVGQAGIQAPAALGTAKKKKGKGDIAAPPIPAPVAIPANAATAPAGKAKKAEKEKPAAKPVHVTKAATKTPAKPVKKSAKPAAKKTAKKKH
ncbi:MAG: Polynucleotide adenylyltransferase [Acidobacteriaceae bacterium]|nr:Polynucleotide adenylyltransferase [Acidobacteriaceae bacterium]